MDIDQDGEKGGRRAGKAEAHAHGGKRCLATKDQWNTNGCWNLQEKLTDIEACLAHVIKDTASY